MTETLCIGPASCDLAETDIVQESLRPYVREVLDVFVPPNERRKGYGAALMHEVVQSADQRGLGLFLEVKSTGEMTDEQLEAFYAKFGFERFQNEPCVLLMRAPRQ